MSTATAAAPGRREAVLCWVTAVDAATAAALARSQETRL